MDCGNGGGANTYFGLRVASVFIILVSSTLGASFPVIAKRVSWLRIPKGAFDFAKYFGSGVIIATAFIHLLSPGLSELSSPCLNPAWLVYPYALAFAMLSIFILFIVELVAFRLGTAKLEQLGMRSRPHGHKATAEAIVENDHAATKQEELSDTESGHAAAYTMTESALAQIIGVAILEFGVLLHSVLIGLTLAVDPNFKILFVVIIFHQTFEGLGIGSRLAFLDLPPGYNWVPFAGAMLYGLTTPIGIAAGLGVRTTYNPGSTTASIVSGVMDSISAGILLYTGLVELLAHEFLFNDDMLRAPTKRVVFAITCMLFGCGIMALLGRWA